MKTEPVDNHYTNDSPYAQCPACYPQSYPQRVLPEISCCAILDTKRTKLLGESTGEVETNDASSDREEDSVTGLSLEALSMRRVCYTRFIPELRLTSVCGR